MSYSLEDIKEQFQIESEFEPYGNGHINDTFVIDGQPRFILQQINTNVFKNPEKLMENITGVTEFLKKKILENGGNPDRETLTVVKTKDGKNYYWPDENVCFRMYKYIEDTNCLDMAENPRQLYYAAKAFGRFQKLLADYPAEELHETIPDFHNTEDRFRQFEEALKNDKCKRASKVQKEIEFALERKKDCSPVLDAIGTGEIPIRVTHNDTKLNNVLLDDKTGEGVCVIDLDTVMPGSLLYDFGDALRFAGSSGSEDEKDLDKIYFVLENYENFTEGFLEELKDVLTDKEKELLSFSVKLMTFECGIRFLTDYLNGDTYFKIQRPEHNLDRCRTQFKLVYDIEQKLDKMDEINKKYF